MNDDDWRQIEFLPGWALPTIQDKLNKITLDDANCLWGYKHVHVREQTAHFPLNINLADFCSKIQSTVLGAICLNNNKPIENAIAIQSKNHTYYGMVNHEQLVALCLPAFDCIDDELLHVASSYGLVVADWCNSRVVIMDTCCN